MNRGLSLTALAALLAAGIAGGVGLASKMEQDSGFSPTSAEAAHVLQASFNRASAIATKAVVHITINEGKSPDDVGSGVIVSTQGHIVTNYHVVRNAQSCSVRFVDGSEYEAAIRGGDPDSDLAVLTIDPKGRDLHPIVFADSDQARVGDIVFAVGSPFGYTHTVTSGIISAKHRVVEETSKFEDYVQTDAAINPGNSGGALVNLRGELIGINTAIVSGSRTNDGVGLAIASNLAKWVKDRLIRDGEVRRGFLGVKRANVDLKDLESNRLLSGPLKGAATTEEAARRLGLADSVGAVVVGVVTGTPASDAGIRPFDVITEIDGRPVRSGYDLTMRVVELEPGSRVRVKLIRDRKPIEITATLIDREDFIRSLPTR